MVGYIGRINDRDLERIEENEDSANYRGTDHIGKASRRATNGSCTARPVSRRSR
jgi:hypothetical protein